MKLQPDKSDVQSISGYGPGWVGVNGEKITQSVIVGSRVLRDANGAWLLRNGLPIADASSPFSVLGSVHPDWTAGFESRTLAIQVACGSLFTASG